MKRQWLLVGALIVLLLVPVVGGSTELAEVLAQGPTPLEEGARAPGDETSAYISPTMSYQGKLVEDGSPVEGSKSMTFRLFPASTGGVALWTEGPKTVSVSNGLFHVTLGDTTALNVNSFDQELWLEIEVAGTTLPRQKLQGAPYAFSLAPGADISGNSASSILYVHNAGSGYGIHGDSTSGHGVYGKTSGSSSNARGVYGYASAASGETYGVFGMNLSTAGRGVYGYANASSGTTYGVYGQSNSTDGQGVYGYAHAGSGYTSGVYGESDSTSGTGVTGKATATSGTNFGVRGISDSSGGIGVYGYASATSGATVGVKGYNNSGGSGAHGVYGGTNGDWGWASGVYGSASKDQAIGVMGKNTAGGYGVLGHSNSSYGVHGTTDDAGNNYGLHTPDNLYSLNYHLAGAVMQVAQNGGKEALEPGDVVVFSGLAAPLEEGGPPVVQVARATAANSTAVAGVVYSRFNVKAMVTMPEQAGDQDSWAGLEVTPEGLVQSGEYLLVVVRGPTQVKASVLAGSVQPGDLLSSADQAGYAAKAREMSLDGIKTAVPGTVLGKALEPLHKGEQLIYVFVTLQ